MKGRNGSTSFLPLNKKGGLFKNVSSQKSLMEDQTKYVYDKIGSGDKIKVRKVSKEKMNKILPHKRLKEKEEMNWYEKVLVSDVNMLDKNKSQMEQRSILSDNIVYVRSVGFEQMSGVDIKMVDYQDHRKMYNKMGKEEGQMINIDFGECPEVLKAKYMDVYEDVFAEVVTTNRFDENVDLSTTYLGKMNMKREDIMKAEESFPISEQGFVIGKVLDGEECQILLDTGGNKFFMSKSHYL